ncbi:MAG: PAS domain S-box protein [Methanolinea sp.]
MTSSYRVLYVDDEPALLEVVRLYLEKKSRFSVDTAISAAEALKKIESGPSYDAVISDYQMPVMDGIEFLKALRRRGNDIPFIIFTGKGREDVVIQALNEGADFYLQKGGDPASQFAELAHVVRKVVRERRVEASIRDMERREADILNFLPDATFAIDLRGTVIAWNRAMERMTGIPAETILGKGDYEYALPFYHERRPILIDLVLRPDPATEAKYPYIRREGDVLISEIFIPHLNDGRGAHLWFLASPLYNSRGEVAGAIETIRDVSEWKILERECDERERFLSTLISNLPGFVYRCRNDRDWTMEYISEGCREITGYAPSDFIGNATVAFNDIIAPSFRDLLWEMWQEVLRERKVFEYEYPIITREGEVRWVWERGRGIFDAEGNVLSLEGFITDITSRKEAEVALRESEERLHDLFMHMEEGFVLCEAILDPSGNLTDWILVESNPAFERITGLSGIKGKRASGIFPGFKEKYPEARAVFEKAIREGSSTKIEVYVEEFKKWLRASVFSPREGYFAAVFEDVTPWKEAELALRESEARFRLLAEGAQDIVYRYEILPKRGFSFVSPSVTSILGYSPDEFYADPDIGFRLVHEEDRPLLEFILSDISASAKPVILRWKRRDGQFAWLELRNRPVYDDAGNLVALEGIARDITERKRAERELAESEEKYRSLLENLPEQILVHRGGHILYANPAALRTFGYSPEEMVDRCVFDFVPPEYHPLIVENIQKREGGSPVEPYEIEVIAKDGTKKTVRVSGSPVVFGGQPATLIVLIDITERKRAEAQIRQAHRKLALLGNVTRHDINNQVFVLSGILALLETAGSGEERGELLARARQAISRILATIRFARDCAQVGESAPRWLNLRGLVEAAGADIPASTVTLENGIPSDIEVFADPMVGRVFANILDNAVRHGGNVTTVRFSAAEEGETLAVTCEDDGAGIPAEEKEKIFERGYGRNTGMGLFLSREILSITGMTIRETGEPGRGARFLITVPRGSWRRAP